MRFEYKAFTQEGEFKRGIVSANSKEEALKFYKNKVFLLLI
jgi:hypothetical protein